MAQHFLLSAAARTLSLKAVMALSDDEARATFTAIRWSDMGIPMSTLVQSIRGGAIYSQGTWVHPQVAIHLAQWLSPQFSVLVSRWVFEWMSGMGSPMSTRRNYIPAFVDRFHLNQRQVPAGYFSVMSELFVVAYALLEREGYVLPQKGAQGQDVSPDISVGRTFSTWLAKKGIPSNHVVYTHLFPDGRKIPGSRAYPNSMLGLFRDFVINVWMRERAKAYLGKVDPPAVPFLEKAIAALPAPEEYPQIEAPNPKKKT